VDAETNRFRDRSAEQGGYSRRPSTPAPDYGPPQSRVQPPLQPSGQPQVRQAKPFRAPSSPRPPGKPPTQPAGDTSISINITLPKLHRPTLPRLPYKRIGLVIVAVAILGTAGWVGYHFVKQAQLHRKQEEAAHAAALINLPTFSKPNFTPVTPASKPNLAAAGQQAAFDGSKDTYSYVDNFNGTQLTVSQQPLPAAFKTPQQAVTAIAKSLGALTPIITNSGTAYMNTDSRSNYQTIVYSTGGLLIFIQSPFTHAVSDWTNYLNGLK
jgi:hypothetical protein